jgi:phosphoribosylamine--glycine ligase
MEARVRAEIVKPTIAGLAAEGAPFKGVLYVGLMIGPEGPRVIEFNCRFGDPEAQVLLPRLTTDLLPALLAVHNGTLNRFSMAWSKEVAVCVVMATKGYPGAYTNGSAIEGLDPKGQIDGAVVFHAATKAQDGHLAAHGGRVLGVTATGKGVAEARERAYHAVDRIRWPDGFCRRDIAWRALAREGSA